MVKTKITQTLVYEIANELPLVHIVNQRKSKWFLWGCGGGLWRDGICFACHIRNQDVAMGWIKGGLGKAEKWAIEGEAEEFPTLLVLGAKTLVAERMVMWVENGVTDFLFLPFDVGDTLLVGGRGGSSNSTWTTSFCVPLTQTNCRSCPNTNLRQLGH
jgi:hypothetical protein